MCVVPMLDGLNISVARRRDDSHNTNSALNDAATVGSNTRYLYPW